VGHPAGARTCQTDLNMADPVVIPLSKIRRPRSTPKGRAVDPVARAQIAARIASVPVESE